ncbi:MAG: hypothetical protein KGI50_01865 [Patescibacteria group bacterium]|nr:hypothetical protein [Patescibacteria group bacterium]MDE2437909.1 hypothetical protein [Patescibacteria group bacterium]
MTLGIYTLQGTLFQGHVKKIIATTTAGEITILDHHIPLVARLASPSVRLVDAQEKETIIKITSGVLEVRGGSEVFILATQ